MKKSFIIILLFITLTVLSSCLAARGASGSEPEENGEETDTIDSAVTDDVSSFSTEENKNYETTDGQPDDIIDPFEAPDDVKDISSINGIIPDEPSQDLLNKIHGDLLSANRIDSNMFISRYYGEYNGAVVFRTDGGLYGQIICYNYIAGYLITEPDTNTEWVWKDGEIILLKEAYERGILTEEQIGNVAWLHYYGKYISVKH